MSRFCWDSLLLCCIVLVGFSAVIVGDEGGDYLDSKEAQVVELSNQASINYNRRCEDKVMGFKCPDSQSPDTRTFADLKVQNCWQLATLPTAPSVCKPLLGDLEGLTCTTVKNNTFCPAPENGITPCTSMNLDYRRGHVRVVASTDLGSVDTMPSICSQRELDPLMKSFTSTNPSAFTRSYFTSMDGSWRVLPGSVTF